MTSLFVCPLGGAIASNPDHVHTGVKKMFCSKAGKAIISIVSQHQLVRKQNAAATRQHVEVEQFYPCDSSNDTKTKLSSLVGAAVKSDTFDF